jgi:hypothetical protein
VTNPSNWSEVRLTNTSFDLEQAPPFQEVKNVAAYGAYWLGEYEGLAAAGNDFVAAWGMPDGTSTNQESIFFRQAVSADTPPKSAATRTSLGARAPARAAVAGTAAAPPALSAAVHEPGTVPDAAPSPALLGSVPPLATTLPTVPPPPDESPSVPPAAKGDSAALTPWSAATALPRKVGRVFADLDGSFPVEALAS